MTEFKLDNIGIPIIFNSVMPLVDVTAPSSLIEQAKEENSNKQDDQQIQQNEEVEEKYNSEITIKVPHIPYGKLTGEAEPIITYSSADLPAKVCFNLSKVDYMNAFALAHSKHIKAANISRHKEWALYPDIWLKLEQLIPIVAQILKMNEDIVRKIVSVSFTIEGGLTYGARYKDYPVRTAEGIAGLIKQSYLSDVISFRNTFSSHTAHPAVKYFLNLIDKYDKTPYDEQRRILDWPASMSHIIQDIQQAATLQELWKNNNIPLKMKNALNMFEKWIEDRFKQTDMIPLLSYIIHGEGNVEKHEYLVNMSKTKPTPNPKFDNTRPSSKANPQIIESGYNALAPKNPYSTFAYKYYTAE